MASRVLATLVCLLCLDFTVLNAFACTVSLNGTSTSYILPFDGIEWKLSDTEHPYAYSYQLSLCGPITQGPCSSDESGVSAYMCQLNPDAVDLATLIYTQPPIYPPPIWSLASKGITFSAANGDDSGCSRPKAVTINLICEANATAVPEGSNAGGSTVTSSINGCSYTANIITSAACISSGGGGGGSGSNDAATISGGSIFLIVLFCSALIYVLGGCVYNRQAKGALGLRESCPNADFWTAIPGLVKDGVLYIYKTLRGLCGGGDGTRGASINDYDKL